MTNRNYDPDFKDLIPLLPTVADFSSVEKVQEARAMRYDMFLKPPPDRGDVSMEDRMVPGPEGAADVAVRIYRPRPRPAVDSGAPRPCVFEIHGGGFMTGSIEMMDPWCQRVAGEIGAVVVS
ncbi:MAG: alpha/beta hydrolase fold domain-containing protein, partial [Deltaproteobacteria bacterium]|nr:alpha/beta hydrolase fold domain-containing protein [Deltaproteobacteria bacterium]